MSTLRARRFLARRQIVCGQATTDCPATPAWHMPEMTTSPENCAPFLLVKGVNFRQLNEFQCNITIHSLKVSEVSACANSVFFPIVHWPPADSPQLHRSAIFRCRSRWLQDFKLRGRVRILNRTLTKCSGLFCPKRGEATKRINRWISRTLQEM